MNNITSPRTDDAGIEQEIQAKGLTAPRVTPSDIEANVSKEYYFNAAEGAHANYWANGPLASANEVLEYAKNSPDVDGPLSLLTFCVLVLRNGFTVTGESACASPENFDAEIGRKIARANAVQKILPLMGYALKASLHERAAQVKVTR